MWEDRFVHLCSRLYAGLQVVLPIALSIDMVHNVYIVGKCYRSAVQVRTSKV